MKKLITLLSLLVVVNAWGLEINDNLISAIIEVESGGNSKAVSPKLCIGLMQLNLLGSVAEWNTFWETQDNDFTIRYHNGFGYTSEEWGEFSRYQRLKGDNVLRPENNIEIGRWYLYRLRDHYGCETLEQLLSAWNGGITRLRKYNMDCSRMPKETRRFVRKVKERMK